MDRQRYFERQWQVLKVGLIVVAIGLALYGCFAYVRSGAWFPEITGHAQGPR